MKTGNAPSVVVISVDCVILILNFIFLLIEGLFQTCLIISQISKIIYKICCQVFLKCVIALKCYQKHICLFKTLNIFLSE